MKKQTKQIPGLNQRINVLAKSKNRAQVTIKLRDFSLVYQNHSKEAGWLPINEVLRLAVMDFSTAISEMAAELGVINDL